MFTLSPPFWKPSGGGASGAPLYVLTFAASLAAYEADGFVFSAGDLYTDNVYDIDTISYPVAPDTSSQRSVGMPEQSGGYYLVVDCPDTAVRSITLPVGLNAKEFTFWYARGGGTGSMVVRAVYSNGETRQIVYGPNGLGEPIFSPQPLNLTVLQRYPSIVPTGTVRIVRVEFQFDNWGWAFIDDLAFY